MTALVTPPPVPDFIPPAVSGGVIRVSANLLPREVLAGRRLAALKKHVGIGLAGFVALLVLVYALSWWQTSKAEDRLTAEQDRGTALLQQQTTYQPIVDAQAKVSAIQNQLRSVMTDDLDWTALLTTLDRSAPAGMTFSTVTASVTGSTAAVSGALTDPNAVLNQSGLQTVGTITITGSAHDKDSVAAFVDTLGKVTGLAGTYPASVAGNRGSYTFTIDAMLTTAVLGGRFTPPTTTPTTVAAGLSTTVPPAPATTTTTGH